MLGRRVSPTDLEIGTCNFGEQAMTSMPAGHSKISGDQTKCPFSQQQKTEVDGNKKEKKQKKPRGGCPLMPSENKRNPALSLQKDYYDTQFISIFGYMLEERGMWALTFDNKQLKNTTSSIRDRRKVFDEYPIYLKHTIFQDDENTKKMRLLEVAQRFFVYDKFREQGNKRMNKGLFEDAIKYYERALGCYKWLEVVDGPDSDDEEQEPQQQQETDEPTIQTEEQKLEEETIKEEIKQYKQDQKDMKKQYKSLMKVYTDDNVKLYNPGSDLTQDDADKELVQSMLFTLNLNMSVCYMNMSHFNLARRVLQDAKEIMENSQLLFRMSQSIACDNWSNYKQLLKAKELIERGIELSNYEKIFKQQPGILMLMNLTNAKQMYVEQAHYVVDRLKNKKTWIVERVAALFERALEIQEIEKEMIEEGKIPFEDGVSNAVEVEEDPLQGDQGEQQEESKNQDTPIQLLYRQCKPQITEEHTEFEIVQEIVRKYYRIIEFYTEQKKDSQISIARRELQRNMETVYEMHFYLNLDFIDYKNDEVLLFKYQKILKELQAKYQIDLTSKKIIRRLIKLCREKTTDLFGTGHFNFEVMDYAMKDYFKRKNEEEKKLMGTQTQTYVPPQKSWISGHLFSSQFALTMFFFGLVAGLFYYLNNNASILAKVIGI